MAKRHVAILCNSCDAPLRADLSFCPNCGRPTVWASHDERVSWEVRQWRATRAGGSESTTLMMLVRTESGYEPAAVDKRASYVWDQPLHPEREAPAASNPHAVRPPLGDRPTNGQAHRPEEEQPAPAPEAVSRPATADAPEEVGGEDPMPSHTPQVSGAVDDRVMVSKKAVAVGIVLALGLPLGGKVLNISGSNPESSRAAVAPAAAPARPVALKATSSGFTQVSPDAARFAVVVANPNRGYIARGVTVAISLFDGSGGLVGTDFERVAAIPAGGRVAVAGQTGVAGRVAGLGIRLSAGSFEGGHLLRPFIVRDVRISRSGHDLVVRAAVSASTPSRGARVVVVHLDRSGRVVGGDFAYVDVPRSPGSATVVVTTSGVTGVDRVEVFVVSTN